MPTWYCWKHSVLAKGSSKCGTLEVFQKIKAQHLLQRPKLVLPYPSLQAIAVL
jgi:hypothetical protein